MEADYVAIRLPNGQLMVMWLWHGAITTMIYDADAFDNKHTVYLRDLATTIGKETSNNLHIRLHSRLHRRTPRKNRKENKKGHKS